LAAFKNRPEFFRIYQQKQSYDMPKIFFTEKMTKLDGSSIRHLPPNAA